MVYRGAIVMGEVLQFPNEAVVFIISKFDGVLLPDEIRKRDTAVIIPNGIVALIIKIFCFGLGFYAVCV